jgi:hypothetical protein
MLTSRRISLALGATFLLALITSACAQAAPITVNLRVEGSTTTLYEGPVTTEAILNPPGIKTESSTTAEPCDVKDNGANGGFGTAAGTPTTALYDAATADGLVFNAEWSKSLEDFDITQVGSDIANASNNEEYWGYAVNYTTAGVGGCQFQLAPGSEVLWAYNYFNLSHLLSLTGPTSANVGSPITLHVVDGQTGAPIAGAAIGEDIAGATTTIPGSPLTNTEGNVTVTLAHTGTVELKATQPESVRSNAIGVCVHNGNEGACGTTPIFYACATPSVAVPPCYACATASVAVPACGGALVVAPLPGADIATIKGVKNGHRYSRRKGPRILQGVVQVPAGGTLKQVRISLQRHDGKRCSVFNGVKESFVRAHCDTTRFFSVGEAESFSYLLPASLPAGRYVYDIEALNDSGNLTKLVPGISHVVFYVK